MRYLMQKDNSGCGPIALLNALKWADPDTSYTYDQHYKTICKAMKKDRNGVSVPDFIEALRAYELIYKTFDYKIIKTFNYKRMINHLRRGGAVILGHYEIPQNGIDDLGGHYSFWVDGNEPNTVLGVNVLRKPQSTVNSFNQAILEAINYRTIEYLKEPLEIYFITRKDSAC